MKSPFRKVIGIDPGKGGGISVITDEIVRVHNCPKTVNDMATLIGLCLNDVAAYRTKVFMEKVWAFPTDGRAGSFTFGENYGQWQGVLASHELNPILVTPKIWQSHFDIKKGLPKDVRKRILKKMAIDKCPETKGITLKTADAILIAIHGIEAHLSTEYDLPWVDPTKMEKVP
ncbi:hypothetical protein CMI47_12050 [Candidatus Pacearchaeota archaeon]|jgi:hypothetical protein|nr:hypothetical protein [Candidatus Pacearchaeota archaeon]|tara:strand:+ start:5543 stop:6061 length:519 start_codon:yes stop_codon:yes gene_type:complete